MTPTRVSVRIKICHDGQVSKQIGPDGIRHGAEENKQKNHCVFPVKEFLIFNAIFYIKYIGE